MKYDFINDNYIRNLIVIRSDTYKPKPKDMAKEIKKYEDIIITSIRAARNTSHVNRWRIDLVLASPNFKLMATFQSDIKKIAGEYAGAFYTAWEHGIFFAVDGDLSEITVLHEFDHAFKAVIHSPQFYPASQEEKIYAKLPYNPNQDREEARQELQTAIDGFSNAVRRSWLLQEKYKSGEGLDYQEALDHTNYQEAIASFHLGKVDIRYKDNLPAEYKVGKVADLVMYIEEKGYIYNSYKEVSIKVKILAINAHAQNVVTLECQNKHEALLYFTFDYLPKAIDAYRITYQNSASDLIPHRIIGEQIAFIHGLGPEIVNVFAPQLARYEQRDLQRWLSETNSTNLPKLMAKLQRQYEKDLRIYIEQPAMLENEVAGYGITSSASSLKPSWQQLFNYLLPSSSTPQNSIAHQSVHHISDKSEPTFPNAKIKYSGDADNSNSLSASTVAQITFWAASKINNNIAKPLASLELNFSDPLSAAAYAEGIKEKNAIDKVESMGFKMEECLEYLFGKPYIFGEPEIRAEMKNFFIAVLNSEIDRETGIAFDKVANITDETERHYSMLDLLPESEPASIICIGITGR